MKLSNDNLTQFYKQYQRLVINVCRGYVSDPDDLNDLCSLVWLRVCQKAHLGPNSLHKDDVAPWLTTVADNVGKNYLESQSKTLDTILDSYLSTIDSEEELEGSWIEQTVPSTNTAEDDRLLAELIMRGASLSEQEHAVFNLAYWHGHSYDAIAKELGIAKDTIGPIVNRLRAKMETKEMYHKAYTYHAPGAVWGDWSWKPDGLANIRMLTVNLGSGPDKYCYTLPDGECVGGKMAGFPPCMHDVVENNNNEFKNSSRENRASL